MEEPEIALPPHAQRLQIDYVLKHMGQVIVTSHSPYVIEKFEPGQIVVLDRGRTGTLTSTSVVLPDGFKLKKYRDNRRQFAEAVLARAVLVVEGATELAVLRACADVLDADPTVLNYLHPDLAGISLFDAGNDVSVPLFAPVFAGMGKPVFGIHDEPKTSLDGGLAPKIDEFTRYQQIPYKGIELLLVTEIPIDVQKRFAATVRDRADYPTVPPLAATASDEEGGHGPANPGGRAASAVPQLLPSRGPADLRPHARDPYPRRPCPAGGTHLPLVLPGTCAHPRTAADRQTLILHRLRPRTPAARRLYRRLDRRDPNGSPTTRAATSSTASRPRPPPSWTALLPSATSTATPTRWSSSTSSRTPTKTSGTPCEP
jgi:hypothetical protein